MIIVLSGEAGAGKDSVAKILVAHHEFVSFSLAAPLKRFADDMFGFTKEQLYGKSSARNEINQRWKLKCLDCGGDGYYKGPRLGDEPCPKCQGTGKIMPISVRFVLQPLGTEYLRDMIHPDVLTMRASWDLEPLVEAGKNVVINDARFQNDRDNLHEWFGAFRVHVVAPDKPKKNDEWRQHRSEKDQPDQNQVEYTLVNPEVWPFPNLPGYVHDMLIRIGQKN